MHESYRSRGNVYRSLRSYIQLQSTTPRTRRHTHDNMTTTSCIHRYIHMIPWYHTAETCADPSDPVRRSPPWKRVLVSYVWCKSVKTICTVVISTAVICSKVICTAVIGSVICSVICTAVIWYDLYDVCKTPVLFTTGTGGNTNKREQQFCCRLSSLQ